MWAYLWEGAKKLWEKLKGDSGTSQAGEQNRQMAMRDNTGTLSVNFGDTHIHHPPAETNRKCAFELTIKEFVWVQDNDYFKAMLRLKNIGCEVRDVTLWIRLPENITGQVPRTFRHMPGGGLMPTILDPHAMSDSTQDFFEPDGRVAVQTLGSGAFSAGLSVPFEGLALRLRHQPLGSEVTLEYQVDAEGMDSFRGVAKATVPMTKDGFRLQHEWQ